MATKIGWEYCECGCKGSEFRFGKLYFWEYIAFGGTGKNMRVSSVSLYSGHGRYSSALIQGTMDQVREYVQAATSKHLTEMKAELVEMEQYVDQFKPEKENGLGI